VCIKAVSDVCHELTEVYECKYAYQMYYRVYQLCIREHIYVSIRIELGDVIELVNTLYDFHIYAYLEAYLWSLSNTP
jgi:hypothetical protein